MGTAFPRVPLEMTPGLDELYRRAKFGNIMQCEPAVGAKMWCLSVFTGMIAAKRQTAGIKFTHNPKIQWRNYGRQWRQPPQGASPEGAPRDQCQKNF